ncbi:MAG: 5-oxoprolinase [Opitutae bacterium]|nr:5-oxoprolinase [Opitutae bacterium]
MKKEWHFYIDTGGTFTDCIGHEVGGRFQRVKVLSRGSLTAKIERKISDNKFLLTKESCWPQSFPIGFNFEWSGGGSKITKVSHWDNSKKIISVEGNVPLDVRAGDTVELNSGLEAPLLGMRLILANSGITQDECLVRMRLATTRCTNALLEEKGIKPVLFITKGFSDLLEIGDQTRINLFDLIPQKRKSLAGTCVEVQERTDAEGNIEVEPDLKKVRIRGKELLASENRIAVVSFINSFKNQQNEKRVAHELRKIGFEGVIESAEIYSFIQFLPRLEASVLEGYLYPVLKNYLQNIQAGLGQNGQLLIMNSAGGLVESADYRAIDSLLSGPAGGVVGSSMVARRAGFERIINLDMGGTSTDVSRFSSNYSYRSIFQVGEARLTGISLNIETVAAGGGSICEINDGKLSVGPKSAGAYPGPACYGFGGPLCLTDVNLLLGRLNEKFFSTPISKSESEKRIYQLIKKTGFAKEYLLNGFIEIANESMARAIRKISVEEGYDPSEHVLVSYGGAGGQHICGVADRLGVKKILSPEDAGLLSAYGVGLSRIERVIEKALPVGINNERITKFEKELFEDGRRKFSVFENDFVLVRKIAFVRMKGQDYGLEIDYQKVTEIRRQYRIKFEEIFGFPPTKKLEIYSLRIHLACKEEQTEKEEFSSTQSGSLEKVNSKNMIYRSDLKKGEKMKGPCIVMDKFGTLLIEDGWIGEKGSMGSILLSKRNDCAIKNNPIVMEELFMSRFFCMVEEMGAQLKRTSLSVNIRDRHDFSCALLDPDGNLVANAPHIPVHLGALGICVRESIKCFQSMAEGDIIVTNHPAYGGSHLPDITVIAPVFSEDGSILAFLANRAHHAEIGGILPGSMPAGSKKLTEEGAVIPPSYLFRQGVSQMDKISELLSSADYPTRQLFENMADLSAQVASLRMGILAMADLEKQFSKKVLISQMNALRFTAERNSSNFFNELNGKELRAVEKLDDGDQLSLSLKIKKGIAHFDFSETSLCRSDNLNANEAIVYSVVAYCLRLLIDVNLPLNEGLLSPVRITIPKGSLLSPVFPKNLEKCPGVAGGNVEISQKLVELILLAFQKVAGSQGTMNNVTFGNELFSHYETIGGGSGAVIGRSGTSAVQVHMTNTAITDPEILESRFPIRLIKFSIRRNSGGGGRWNGGDGIVREFLFDEKSQISLLTQNRVNSPSGLNGGMNGKCGEQYIIRKDGTKENLLSVDASVVFCGDRLIIKTPGGGGAASA